MDADPQQLSLDDLLRPKEGTVGKALDRIRRDSRNESEKGEWFENLTRRVLMDNPEYEVAETHRWMDWPEREPLTGLDGRDIGIDLVAKLRNGGWVAIQSQTMSEQVLDQADLNEIVRRIVAVAQPEKITLLGSGAHGEMDRHTDVELLIVIDGPDQRRVAVDLPDVTLADVDRYRDSYALIIKPAFREGRVVYDASLALSVRRSMRMAETGSKYPAIARKRAVGAYLEGLFFGSSAGCGHPSEFDV